MHTQNLIVYLILRRCRDLDEPVQSVAYAEPITGPF